LSIDSSDTAPERSPKDAVAAPIVFGTNGWRGVFGEDFTLPRVRIAVRAVARWLAETSPGGEVVVAHDTRPDGERFAELASALLRARGAKVTRLRGAVPTPVVTRAVVRRAAAAAVVFTASHNPPEYRGMKVFGSWGGGLEEEQTRRLEERAAGLSADGEAPAAEVGPPDAAVDLVSPYLRDLLAEIDVAALRRSNLQVVYDAMHGAGSGVLDRAIRDCGVAIRTLRGDPDPHFGGAAPDPIPGHLRGLERAVRELGGTCLGLATDGDADRFAVVGAEGRVLSETEAVALLVDHLARTGRVERGVAISFATGTLVERVAASHGLRVERHPIGFKHLSRALCSGAVDAAGEESGGFALARFGVDKDGILAGCLFAEMAVSGRATLGARLAELERRHGRSFCGRIALPRSARSQAMLDRLAARPPKQVDGARVRAVTCRDGLHLALDDGFLMFRASGTEPLLRIYGEAPAPRLLTRRLAAAGELLAG
jgi:phosphoglucomutase